MQEAGNIYRTRLLISETFLAGLADNRQLLYISAFIPARHASRPSPRATATIRLEPCRTRRYNIQRG